MHSFVHWPSKSYDTRHNLNVSAFHVKCHRVGISYFELAFEISLICVLDNSDSYIVINRPLSWMSTLLTWNAYPSIYLRQRNELEGLKQTAKPFKNFIKGCWGCQGCWFTVFLLSSVTSQRPKHSVGYKQKEFLRAAKVVIKWLLYYSGIRSDERKRREGLKLPHTTFLKADIPLPVN